MRWLWLFLVLLVCPAQAQVQFCGLTKTPCWTTGGRPSTPGVGTFGFNRTLVALEAWDGSNWIIPTGPGSAATPIISLGAATQGFYKVVGTSISSTTSDGVGLTSNSKSIVTANYRVDTSGAVNTDNVIFRCGTGQAIVAKAGSDTYVCTIATPSVTQSGNSQYVGFNIGSVTVTATDTVTKVSQQAMIEFDKIDFAASGGAVIYSDVANVRSRFNFAGTNVTFTTSKAYEVTMPAAFAGTVGTYVGYNVPVMATGAGYSGTSFYGMLFNASMPTTGNSASIGSLGAADLTIRAGVTAGAANLILDSITGTVRIQTVSVENFRISGSGSQLNYGDWSCNNTCLLQAKSNSATTNVGLNLSSLGTSSLSFLTGGGTLEQVRVTNTATANQFLQLTGGVSGGAAPSISTQGTGADINLNFAPKGAGILQISGTNTVSKTYNVRAAGGAGDCTIIVVSGLATGGTC